MEGTVHHVYDQWTYDAWGNVLSSNVSVTALASLRYRFQGRELSAVTGLMNFRMRWYDVVTGRWLSKDPIGLLGGGNNYVFCCDVPLMFFDILGTYPERPQLRRRLGPPPKPRKPRTKSATIVGARAAATLGITAAISALVDSEGNVGIGFTGGEIGGIGGGVYATETVVLPLPGLKFK
jgi:RHS repeat-associated protein